MLACPVHFRGATTLTALGVATVTLPTLQVGSRWEQTHPQAGGQYGALALSLVRPEGCPLLLSPPLTLAQV